MMQLKFGENVNRTSEYYIIAEFQQYPTLFSCFYLTKNNGGYKLAWLQAKIFFFFFEVLVSNIKTSGLRICLATRQSLCFFKNTRNKHLANKKKLLTVHKSHNKLRAKRRQIESRKMLLSCAALNSTMLHYSLNSEACKQCELLCSCEILFFFQC